MNDKITQIIVLGGGTAGWLTAAIIAAEHRISSAGDPDSHAFQLTLVESPDIPTIGVGEGTWPSMRSTLQKIGVSETDFLRECSASFKQGTFFQNWLNDNDDSFGHPFTVPHSYAEMNLAAHWQTNYSDRRFADVVSPQTALFADHLAPKQITTPEYAFSVNYGYHLDAGKFAEFLCRHCIENLGITHITANVTAVESTDNGDIKAIRTDRDDEIQGDLFIDCSGSRALLLAQHYKIPFEPVNDILFNNTALAVQVPYKQQDAQIHSCTLSTARDAGWIWDVGLPTRRGVGYTYSDAHQSEEQAADTLVDYVASIEGNAAAKQVSARKISFSPGFRSKFWHRNCVAVGMSSGFIEPLEASALVMVELAATMIAEQLPANRSVMDLVARQFNEKCRHRWNRIIEFLKLHYILSDKEQPYWRDNRVEASIPIALQESLQLWRYQSPWHLDSTLVGDLFPSASYQYILYGMHFQTQPRHTKRRNEAQNAVVADRLIQENAQRIKGLKSALPTNSELLQKVYEYGFQKI
jgi:flavin-dependent dehydrogenase